MIDFISSLFIDLSLLAGITLFALSFTQKFKKQKFKLLVISIVLIAIGLLFFDTAGASEAYQNGVEAAESIINN